MKVSETMSTNEQNKRSKLITIRVSEMELELLKKQAQLHSLSVSNFLRKLGTNHIVNSTIDQQAIRELLNVAGDLGRLGGLFKLWLSMNANAEIQPKLGDKEYNDIVAIVGQILELKDEIRNKVKELF